MGRHRDRPQGLRHLLTARAPTPPITDLITDRIGENSHDLDHHPSWINGTATHDPNGRTADVTNPATGAITGQVALASAQKTAAAIDAAEAAFPAWRDTSLARRTHVMFALRELLNARKGELAEIITREHGKVLSDALGEVTRGQEVVEFACGIPHLMKGGFTENASTKVDA